MSLGNILAVVALALPVMGGAYHYQYVHLPDFKAAEAETYYARCMRECRIVCTANGIPAETCNCGHCLKHLEGA